MMYGVKKNMSKIYIILLWAIFLLKKKFVKEKQITFLINYF